MHLPDHGQPSDEPQAGANVFHNDMHAGLARMRLRLLEMTNRNRLLHFRHTRSSSLRVVDELPDQLFERLRNGSELIFNPVPRPLQPSRSSDEKQSALGRPTAKEHAESLGLATSFDLPLPNATLRAEVPSRHNDNEIQTLHYPDELERILGKIASAARLAIEETGTNMLYLVFGFLEWYEHEISEDLRLAPLVLLPVLLRRGDPDLRTHTFPYFIQYSGEDVVANLSLQERMRRDFNLEIPDLADDETPEAYYAQVQPIFASLPRWTIRRQITLTLLSFGKLLMYRDLDPQHWPLGKGPDSHPRIRELFVGIQHENITVAPDYAIDDPELRTRVPALIYDTDSSQHSALIDAIQGNNLVIEGPPGTGKSQTITNMIAAALVAGKTVLFMSEKLAALEVVRNRLDKAGLGLFCLELHSHKTQKKELLEDLAARLRQQHQLADPQVLNDKLQLLERDKRRLTEHATLINSPCGRLGLSVHDLLWGYQRRRQLLGAQVTLFETLQLPAAQDLTLADVEERRQLLRVFAHHLTAVLGNCPGIAAHPWHGVTNTGLIVGDERKLLDTLTELAHLAETLDRSITDLNATWLCALQGDADILSAFVDAVDSLPSQEGMLIEALLPSLVDNVLRLRLERFGHEIHMYRQFHSLLEAAFGHVPDVEHSQVYELQQVVTTLPSLLPTARTIGDLEHQAGMLEAVAADMTRARVIYDEIARQLGYLPPFTRGGLDVVGQLLLLLRTTPAGTLEYRHPGLWRDDAYKIIREAQREAAPILALRTQLSQRIRLDQAPMLAEVRQYAVTYAKAGVLGFLKRDVRRARRAHAAITLLAKNASRDQIRHDFRDLSEYLDRLQRFPATARYREVAGSYWAGIDTPFEELALLADWWKRIRLTVEQLGDHGRILGSAVWSTPLERLHALAYADGLQDALLHATTELGDAIRNVTSLLVASDYSAAGDLVAFEAHLTYIARQARWSAASLRGTGLTNPQLLDAVPHLLDQLAQSLTLRKSLTADHQVASTLGGTFAGANTAYERVAYTCVFRDAVIASNLPEAVKQLLLSPGAATRLITLTTHTPTLRTLLRQFHAAITAFSTLAGLNEGKWYGSGANGARHTFVDIARRARTTLTASDQLNLWIDYQRTRQAAARTDLGPLLEIAEERRLQPGDLDIAFEFVLLNSLVRNVFSHFPDLAQFSGLTHEQIRARFIQLDRETIQLYRKRAAYQVIQRPVFPGNGVGPISSYTEFALIRHELGKQRRHIPIRQLVRRAGRALQALKPCFMMGPLSVAQYLPPDELKFDLVIMDEASQLKPEDALGAIARCKQMVVVGDRMQLPPSSFFDRLGDEEDFDEENLAQALADSESILDVASRVYIPVRLLKWHYRSQHGSLIAFSNKEFYKGELIVFPSPVAVSPDLGVQFVFVADGVYENRRNMVEARRVVDAVLEHMRTRSHESLGVVTLNIAQREVIEEEFERRLKDDPYAQSYIEQYKAGLEPFFIKNLENIQGDEREVIFISVTYGPASTGHVFQRFGPINTETGHRRLNVLFTRAKRRVVVFSSMFADAIQARPDTKWGVRAFKNYLAYAQTGILDQAQITGREADSDFEVEVAHALREHGFQIEPQVGVAGYFIDIAIKHPQKADAYILAVECDGATYHSARSARDRDRLRQEVLESLGWRVHRIWSTDWFKHRDREIDRLVARIQDILCQEEEIKPLFTPPCN